MQQYTRRSALHTSSIALFGLFAGCSALSTESTDSEGLSLERLDTTAVYVDDEVALSMPAEIETVTEPHNADLLVLSGDTNIDGEQAVEWFTDDRIIALLGDSSEATWLSWARSDAFRDAFKNGGSGDSEPDPSLVVGARVGLYVTTHRRSWSGTPRDRDILRALDEVLVAIEKETPPG